MQMLNRQDIIFLVTEPDAFAALVMAETPRPWTDEDREHGRVLARMLPEDEANDAFALGLSLIHKLGLLPKGIDYPKMPLSRLDSAAAQEWMQEYADAAQRQMQPKGKVLKFSGQKRRSPRAFCSPKPTRP
jgi:hypothetical protein